MAFVKTPMYHKNTYTVPLVLKRTPHTGDIYTLDSMDGLVASAGVDNRVCLWNAISGGVRSVIAMPRRDNKPNLFVSQVKFMKSYPNGEGYPQALLLIIQNNGDIYTLNPVSEVISSRIIQV